MNKDLTGLGDNDLDDIDRKRLAEMRARNPNNEAEVTLEMWTLATLINNGHNRRARRVVYGVVTKCLTDEYVAGEIVCSPTLIDVTGRICASQWLRYKCKGPGNEIEIPEEELSQRLPNKDDEL